MSSEESSIFLCCIRYLTQIAATATPDHLNGTFYYTLDDLQNFRRNTAPIIPISAYLRQLYRLYCLSDEVLVVSLIYMKQLQERARVTITRYEIHRLLATALMISAKYNCDDYYSNKYYASSAGLRLNEINVLEYEMLELLGYRLEVAIEKYEEFISYLNHY